MKTKILISLTAALLLAMPPGCARASVGVNRSADENNFVLEFRVLNTSEYHTFELAAGDEIEAEIVRESGDISITVQKGKDDPVYEGAKPLSGTFRIGIEESGNYRVTVTGNEVKGRAEFHVIRSEREEGEE